MGKSESSREERMMMFLRDAYKIAVDRHGVGVNMPRAEDHIHLSRQESLAHRPCKTNKKLDDLCLSRGAYEQAHNRISVES